MASTMRYEGHPSSGDASTVKQGITRAPLNLASFRQRADAARIRSLSALIESEIIPRLMVAHSAPLPDTLPKKSEAAPPVVRETPLGVEDVETFAPLVMQAEADALLAHVESILSHGVAFDSLLVDLLAPTARLLGELWAQDRCDFVDVTMGLWRLQEIVHEISGRPSDRAPVAGTRRALFSPMPGELHSFGTVVIDNIFRQEGWQTDRLSDGQTSELLKRASEDWFDIIGLTVSCDCHIAALPSLIAALRNVSRNPRVCVMVGGRVFSADPDLAFKVGADATAKDAKIAPKLAENLVRQRECEFAS